MKRERTLLIQARESVGMTRPELAKRMGRARSYVYKVEVGDTDPGLNTIMDWLYALPGTSIEMFEPHPLVAKWADVVAPKVQRTIAHRLRREQRRSQRRAPTTASRLRPGFMGARRRAIFEPSEDQITDAAIEHWRIFGTAGSLVAGIPNKRAFGQPGLTPGLPDLLVLSMQLGDKTGFIELKRERGGRLSDAQLGIGRLMRVLGVPYAVCAGRDQPIEQLRAWGAIR